MRQRINRLLMLGKRGLTGPVFQRIGARLWAHAGRIGDLGGGLPAPRMTAASVVPGCVSILVDASEDYVGDTSATWIVKIAGVGDFPATGEPVYEVPVITTTDLESVFKNVPTSQRVYVEGVGLTFDISAGALPDGLTLSSNGIISGTPTTVGAYDFTVRATNPAGSDTQQFTMAVNWTMMETLADATFTRASTATVYDSTTGFSVAAIDERRTQDGGYLQEAAATCILAGSADFDSAETYWGGVSIGWVKYYEKTSIFPGGTAWQGVEKNAGSRNRIQVITVAMSTVYTAQCYIEVFDGQTMPVEFGINDTGAASIWAAIGRLQFDTVSRTVDMRLRGTGHISLDLKNLGAGPNGGTVYRIDWTFNTNTINDTTVTLTWYPTGTQTDQLAGGDTIIHGCDIKEGYSASSFVISGAAATTRAADALSFPVVMPQSVFAIYVEFELLRDPLDLSAIADIRLFGTTDSGGTTKALRTARGDTWSITQPGGGAQFALDIGDLAKNVKYKAVFGSDGTDLFTYVNGAEKQRSTLTVALDHSDVGVLTIGNWSGGYSKSLIIQAARVHSEPLTPAELIAMTS